MSIKKFSFFTPQLCAIDEDTNLIAATPKTSIKTQLQSLLDQKTHKIQVKDSKKKLNPAASTFVPTFSVKVVEKDPKPIKESPQPSYTKIGKFQPAFKPRAKLNIYIGKRETKTGLDKITEPFDNTSMLYHYLDVSTAFQMTDSQMYLYQTSLEPMVMVLVILCYQNVMVI
eukprot:393642_1